MSIASIPSPLGRCPSCQNEFAYEEQADGSWLAFCLLCGPINDEDDDCEPTGAPVASKPKQPTRAVVAEVALTTGALKLVDAEDASFFEAGDQLYTAPDLASAREELLREFEALAKEWSAQIDWSAMRTPHSEAVHGVTACRNALEDAITRLRAANG